MSSVEKKKIPFLTKMKGILPSKRKIMQLYFGLLFNANLKGFVTGSIYKGNSKMMCVPGLNCYSCPGAIGACPLGSLQGSFSAGHSTIYYVGGILLLYGILFGRMICGWLCPFGLVQELVYKLKTPKVQKSPITRLLSCFKYVLLVFFVFVIPIMYALRNIPLPAFCKYICPAGTLEGGVLLLSNAVNASYLSMLGPLFTWKFLLMVSILVGCVFIFRLFCRFICPLGALYGVFNKISIFGIQVEKHKCIHCGLCTAHCKADIKYPGDRECISCGACVDGCPTKAILWKGPKIFLKENEGSNQKSGEMRLVMRIISGVVMLAILAGTIGYCWSNTTDPISQGLEVGDLCYGYDLEIIDSTGITSNTVNPTKTGKITVINFWGTWCGPCVEELPYFHQIATDYKETVSVIAVHTNIVSDTAPEFIKEYYPGSPIIFARDYLSNGLEGYYTALGGRGTYPYTVILDENGIILSVFIQAVEYEDLQRVIEEHLK